MQLCSWILTTALETVGMVAEWWRPVIYSSAFSRWERMRMSALERWSVVLLSVMWNVRAGGASLWHTTVTTSSFACASIRPLKSWPPVVAAWLERETDGARRWSRNMERMMDFPGRTAYLIARGGLAEVQLDGVFVRANGIRENF